jgi:hypothetical protein
VAAFATIFHQDKSSEQDVFGHWQYPVVEHGPDCMRKPLGEVSPLYAAMAKQVNPETKFRKRHRTDVKFIQWVPETKVTTFSSGLGLRIPEKNIGVEKPCH